MFKFFKKDKKSSKKLWQQFKGKCNTDNVLIDKAKSLAPIIIGLAVKESQELKKYQELKKVTDDKFKEVSFEMIPFYIHYADRVAFQYLKSEQRKKFVIALFTEIREQLSSVCKNENDAVQFKATFTDTYFNRQEEYSKYKLPINKKEKDKENLFWQFNRKIASILGDETDIRIMTYIQMIVLSSLSVFQLPELFQEE